LGGTLHLSTPTGPARLKLAATSTNFAWPTGVIFISTHEYARLWANATPTALGVELAPGASAATVQSTITRQLGVNGPLEVSTQRARQRKIEASAGEALSQLAEISTLLLVAAILAMAAAVSSAIWQRRVSLAGLRLAGVAPPRLRRILLIESALILGAGCLTGAVAGIYGQVIVDRYLRAVTGFPVASISVGERPVEILALVLAVTLAIVAIPGWFGSRVPPTLALEAE
jgi:putative ABC transport system permease protein